ncbi:hypothetical protein Celaphus_00016001 [Cervus elaphus hippelaphus]|uniref:RRM domain-containing protein n=1 Tax=Cervus elaphus hippelaphus TaxID=46360 RepID=A0A212C1M0_CEREH|nr:hypothetical protein Celaphus_00016001 [Cervus elaphus hippelaphus]
MSTVHVSNLPSSLVNSGFQQILSRYGEVIKATITKDKDTRRGTGNLAQSCTKSINNKQLFGRVIKASIAIDNGRAADTLGGREPPKKKKKKKKKIPKPEEETEEDSEDEGEDPALNSLSQATDFQQVKIKKQQKMETQFRGVHQYQMIQNAQG